jgi:hypothetical protein
MEDFPRRIGLWGSTISPNTGVVCLPFFLVVTRGSSLGRCTSGQLLQKKMGQAVENLNGLLRVI